MIDQLKAIPEKYRQHLLPLLLLAVAVLAVYMQILGHDFLSNWDDNKYVLENADVHGIGWDRLQAVFTKFYLGNYAPVQMLSYMLDYALWGLHPGGFCFTNLVLHALNGLLVYRLLFRLISDRLAAWCGAALFLLHPVQVETVAWISQRKNLLAMLFFLIAWDLYLLYRKNDSGKRHLFYAMSLTALLLALLSKSVAVIFPVAMLLFDYCYYGKPGKSNLLDKVPYLIVSVVAAFLAILSQTPDPSDWSAGGGRTGYHGGSLAATFLTMLPVFCSYLRMIVWPFNLSALYDPAIYQSFNPVILAASLFLCGICCLIYLLFRFDRNIAFWPLFSIIALLPVSQIVPLVTLMNDRYLYFPMVGVAALLAYGVKLAVDRWPEGLFRIIVCVVVLLGFFSIISMRRAEVWRNVLTLWGDTVRKSPKLPLAWELFGEANHYSAKPNRKEAEKAYLQAIKLSPKSELSHYNLGVLYIELNDFANADRILNELLDLSPQHVMGWTAFGDLAFYQLKYAEAESRYHEALSFQPDAIEIHRKIGRMMVAMGRVDEARRSFQLIESLDGGYDPANAYSLARIEAVAGDTSASIRWLELALKRGYHDFAGIMGDEALMPVRIDGRFAYLVKQYFPKQQ